tara:strand:- start:18004 stop:18240 length:237 start_codon:yes stop_codon:yes gene_type:complete
MTRNKDCEWCTNVQQTLGELNAHHKNIYHHIKRIDDHLRGINGSVHRHDVILSKWKGISIGVIGMSTAISTVISYLIK